MQAKVCLLIAALLGASGVALGAYHAHGLEKMLDKRELSAADHAKTMDQCGTAVRYQLFHAVAVLGVGAVVASRPSRLLVAAACLYLLGVSMFSGGLYLIVFAQNGIHWSIVPLGGLTLIIAWVLTGVGGLLLKAPE